MTRLSARWRGRKGADVRGRLVRRLERLAWCRGKVEEAGRGAGIDLLGRVSGEKEKEKGSWAVGAGLGQREKEGSGLGQFLGLGWVLVLGFFLILFLFLLFSTLAQTNLFEFKQNLNPKPYSLKQIK